jgi:chemotaxis signal transduction protein
VTTSHAFIRGISIVRGVPVSVLHLGTMLGGAETEARRLVIAKIDGRLIGLLVEQVCGVQSIDVNIENVWPPILHNGTNDAISAIGLLDRQLLFFLNTLRLVPLAVIEEIDRVMAAS